MSRRVLIHWIESLLFAGVLLSCKEDVAVPPSASQTADLRAQSVTPAFAPTSVAPQVESPPPWANRFTKNSGFPCAIEQVLVASCRRCHWEPRENDAPFSLLRWEDTQKVRTAKPIYVLMRQMVEADLMPPLDLSVDPKVKPLTADQKKTLLAWLEAGAIQSQETCSQP